MFILFFYLITATIYAIFQIKMQTGSTENLIIHTITSDVIIDYNNNENNIHNKNSRIIVDNVTFIIYLYGRQK